MCISREKTMVAGGWAVHPSDIVFSRLELFVVLLVAAP